MVIKTILTHNTSRPWRAELVTRFLPFRIRWTEKSRVVVRSVGRCQRILFILHGFLWAFLEPNRDVVGLVPATLQYLPSLLFLLFANIFSQKGSFWHV